LARPETPIERRAGEGDRAGGRPRRGPGKFVGLEKAGLQGIVVESSSQTDRSLPTPAARGQPVRQLVEVIAGDLRIGGVERQAKGLLQIGSGLALRAQADRR